MIVDDDKDILNLVRAGLEKAGFEVGEADGAGNALNSIRRRRPDLLITDAMMPGKDGYQLARELRLSPETALMPIIMLTALQGEGDALRAFQEGVDDFVSKPFSMAVLRARVSALLNRAMVYSSVLPGTVEAVQRERKLTGVPALDEATGGGIPEGSNILLLGDTGTGKSRLGRRFIATGLAVREKGMIIAIDDNPRQVRRSLDGMLDRPLSLYEKAGCFRLIDCYSWSRGFGGGVAGGERFAVTGALELNQLE